MAKKENIPKKEKKKEKKPNITANIVFVIIGLVIIVALIYYFKGIINKEKIAPVNQSLGNYTIPTTNIDQKDFVCPPKKYLNCVPPILLSDDFCMNPYRQWIEKNCPDVKIFE